MFFAFPSFIFDSPRRLGLFLDSDILLTRSTSATNHGYRNFNDLVGINIMSRPCAFGCVTYGLTLHRFPIPKYPYQERFYKWKSILPQSLQAKGDRYIITNLRLCDKHFESFYRLPSKMLTRNAVPTLCLNSTLPITEEVHFTTNVPKEDASTSQCDLKTSLSQKTVHQRKGDSFKEILSTEEGIHSTSNVPKNDESISQCALKTSVSQKIDHQFKDRGILPKECVDTADFLLMIDKLFDSFNGHSYQDSSKPFKGCLKDGSPHFKLWEEILPILRSIGFKTTIKKRDGSIITKYIQVPSIKHWVHNINVFKEMYVNVKRTFNIKNLLTRNFNQDPLEIFFCNIRSNGIRNTSPTCENFTGAFKTLLVNNSISVHSVGANCERDNNRPLQSLKFMLTKKRAIDDNPKFQIDSFIKLLWSNSSIGDSSHEAKEYVAGYIIKKCREKVCQNCKKCKEDLNSLNPVESFVFERDYTKKSLNYPSQKLSNILNEIYSIITLCLREAPEANNIKEKVIHFVNIYCTSFFTCEIHKEQLFKHIIKTAIDVIIHSWCTTINRLLNGKITMYDETDLTKLEAVSYYERHKKLKKK